MSLSIFNAPFPFNLKDFTMTLLSMAATGAVTAWYAAREYYAPTVNNKIGYLGYAAIGSTCAALQIAMYNAAVIYRQRKDGRPDVNSKYHNAAGRWVGDTQQ